MAALLNPRTLVALAICVVALGAGAFAFASTGSGDDGVLRVELRDGSVELEERTVPAGRQVIEVANAGTEEHEVVLLRTDSPPDEVPVGLHGVSPSLAGELLIGEDHVAAGHAHRPGQLLGLAPARSQRYEVELTPGRYVVLCQTDNHYLEGEWAPLEVR